jgi:Ca-activated chloride channel family protein
MLLLLFIIPVVIGIYWWLDRRRGSLAARFTPGKPARKQGFRRHIPAILFLLGLMIVMIALARPQAEVRLPRVEGTVILVMDVSASMGAKDAEPTRLEAAKTTAREFINSQPETVKIGIVSFSGSGFAVQTPTSDKNV